MVSVAYTRKVVNTPKGIEEMARVERLMGTAWSNALFKAEAADCAKPDAEPKPLVHQSKQTGEESLKGNMRCGESDEKAYGQGKQEGEAYA